MFDVDQLFMQGEEAGIRGETVMPVAHLALIGNALPRKCGLATFTSHVADALAARYPAMQLDHYAMDDGSGVDYPDGITVIEDGSAAAYRDAAATIEASGADAIWLQHEYGIFGGTAGSHILELIGATDLPLIVTLHTVLAEASAAEDAVLERILARADRIVVMADLGRDALIRRFGVAEARISVIPHGVPDRHQRDPDTMKARFGWQGRKVLMTFGLLAPDKGIRHMIEAMPAIVAAHPEALYVVVGASHPNLVRHEGEQHRHSLMALAQELGIGEHVRFVDAFVEQEELLDMLQASDLYVTPYLNMAQVTSGTLSYAVAVGKPVISTPYVHARELLADGRGLIVPKADAAALADAAIALLSDDARRATIAGKAYDHGRTMLWPRVVEQALLPLADRDGAAKPATSIAALPLDALARMSDSVGMLQHGVFGVADRSHGYCVDDNARALLAMVLRGGTSPKEARMTANFAAFVEHSWNPDTRRFRNFMGYDRRWLEPVGSDDSNGRTLWALGVTESRARDAGLRGWAATLFDAVAPHMAEITSPRARAFAALAGDAVLDSRPGDEAAYRLLRASGEQLVRLHAAASRPGWNWFEPELAYDNARLPQALIRAGERLGDDAMVALGLSTLGWLVGVQTGPRGNFRPVGSNGFGRAYAPPLAFDQQPLEATATIDAAVTAFGASGDARWRTVARDAFGWFFGDNDAGVPIADLASGGCFDGLMASGINRNQGAESILSLHLAVAAMGNIGVSRNWSGHQAAPATDTDIVAATA